MENENEKQIALKENGISSLEQSINKIKHLESLVKNFENSSLATPFKSKIYPKGKDGKIDLDAEPIEVFNSQDMVICLALGDELGIPPITALSYGTRLNLQAVKQIEKGKKLGLDYATALEKIYIWGEGSKEIVYTAIEIVTACLTRVGVKKEIIQTGKDPIWYCYNWHTGQREKFNPSIHKEADLKPLTDEQRKDTLKALSENGIIAVLKDKQPLYIAEVKLTRFNRVTGENEVISIPYSSQEAIDAGLLKGINSDGETVKGKPNWNAHRATHLIKMSIMIGGRLIAPDVLSGVYNEAEIPTITKNTDSSNFVDVEVVEEN